MAQQRLDRHQVHAAFQEMGRETMSERIIILLTNSLPRRSITDIILFMEQKSKWCVPYAASTKRAL
jgi:hypothetical protein